MTIYKTDHRAYLYNSLEGYLKELEKNNFSKREMDHVANTLKFIEREPMCFERACEEGHITGSSWLLNKTRDKALLTHHKKLNIWVQLGGHSDGDSDTSNVAFKECYEESGFTPENIKFIHKNIFDVDVHLIPESKKKGIPAHYHYDVRYLLQVIDSEDYVVSDESHDLAWFTIEEMNDFVKSQSIRRMSNKWKKLGL